jgi:ABC-type sugar transport system permease subunit
MWRFIYYPEVGVMSRILDYFNVTMPNLLGVTGYVMAAIIFIGFPWIAGINYIIMYSAFQAIDSSLIEASNIDGADGWTIFFKIELPLIMPQIKALLVLAVIGLVQDYERFLILTDGGPNNASLVPGLHMYHMGFGNGDNQYGYACAIAVVLFLITLGASILLMRRKKGGEF